MDVKASLRRRCLYMQQIFISIKVSRTGQFISFDDGPYIDDPAGARFGRLVLLLYVPSQQLCSLRDGQFT